MDIIGLIPVARSLAKWSQADLADRCNLNAISIANIENRKVAPKQASIDAILAAFNREGIEFIENGVQKPAVKTLMIGKSPGWFPPFLEEVYQTLKNHPDPELLIFGVDDRLTTPDAIEKFRKLRNAGVKMRFFICDGDTFMRGDESEYRWIPAHLFMNYNTFIFGNKICNDFGEQCQMVINEAWAQAERNKFNVMWETCQPVTERSTADVRYDTSVS